MRVLEDWELTPWRAAIHVETATAVIADVHLGYDGARRRGGEAVPRFGAAEYLAWLRALVSRHGARRLVVAGDLCEDGRHADAIDAFLDGLVDVGLELAAVVPGNHDRAFPALQRLPIRPEVQLGRWRIEHGDRPAAEGWRVQGHVHPCWRWRGVSAPCYLVGASTLVLPAFSRDVAGVNVARPAAWRGFRRCVIVGEQVVAGEWAASR
jgi:putative SbcD/Mre11-related phosphoesterase